MTVAGKARSSIAASLGMGSDALWGAFETEVDVNFDVKVSCTDRRPVLKVSNVVVDVDNAFGLDAALTAAGAALARYTGRAEGLKLNEYVELALNLAVDRSLDKLVLGQTQGVTCTNVTAQTDGSVVMTLATPPTPSTPRIAPPVPPAPPVAPVAR